MATQPKRETWAHVSSTEGVYTWMEVSSLADGPLMVATPMTKDRTNLNVEDLKCVDWEHQAIHHFICLWSKGTWRGHVQIYHILFAKQNSMNKYIYCLFLNIWGQHRSCKHNTHNIDCLQKAAYLHIQQTWDKISIHSESVLVSTNS